MVTDFTDTIPEDWVWNTTEPIEPEVFESAELRALRKFGYLVYFLVVVAIGLLLSWACLDLSPEFAYPKRHRRGLRSPGKGLRLRARIVAWRVTRAVRCRTPRGVVMVGRARDGRVLTCPLPSSWLERRELPRRVVVYADPQTNEVLGVRAQGRSPARTVELDEPLTERALQLGPEHEMPAWTRSALHGAGSCSPYR